jgi:hypothetical protein
LQAYLKLRGSIADETVLSPYEGDIFLVADGQVGIPLCGFKGVQKSVWRRHADGTHTNEDYDLGFYGDYASRETLDTWNNPLTGKTVRVFHYRGGPTGGTFKVGVRANDAYSDVMGRWSVIGGQIWHTSASWGERPNPLHPADWPLASSGETLLGSMSMSFAGRIQEVADRSIRQVPALQLWTNTTSWMPWMEMGRRPGSNLWRWLGAKGTPAAAIDASLVAALEQVWPGYINHGESWTVPTSGRIDYMRLKSGLALTP